MLLPLVPFVHITVPVQLLTLSSILVPEQTVLSASFELIIGVVGRAFTTILASKEDSLRQPFNSQTAP
jgi:hypothetical protein